MLIMMLMPPWNPPPATQARAAKDFARSDAIRVDLAAKGVLLLDTPEGTSWRPGSAASL